MTKATSLLAALTLAFGASTAIAQVESPAGVPADPTTEENLQMAPGTANPSDPAAGSEPAARAPTAPTETAPSAAEGMSTGEGGVDEPAGLPGDPNTPENQQTGPSPTGPTDPAAGSNPDARVPTDDLTD